MISQTDKLTRTVGHSVTISNSFSGLPKTSLDRAIGRLERLRAKLKRAEDRGDSLETINEIKDAIAFWDEEISLLASETYND